MRRTKMVIAKKITRENFHCITVLDIQSEIFYESAKEFFIFNENAKKCYAMLVNQNYTAADILSYSKEEQEEIKYKLMLDSLNLLKEDGFILYYTHTQELN